MNPLKPTILIAGILAAAPQIYAQRPLLTQDFDTSPVNYTLPPNSAFIHQGTKYWDLSSNLGADLNPRILGNTTTYLTGQNMDPALPFSTTNPAQIDFMVNVGTFANLKFSIDLAGIPTAEVENYVRAFTDDDGDGFYETQVFNFVGANNTPYIDAASGGQLSATFQTFSNFALNTPTALDKILRIRIEVYNDTDSLNEAIGLDNIVISTTDPAPGLSKFYNFGAGAGVWDTTTMNWRLTDTAGTSDATFANDDKAVFGNLGTAGARTVTVAAAGVAPGDIAVSNATGNDYTIGGGGVISGFATLTKDGTGNLTMLGANTFAGGTTIKHGTVNVATIGDATTAGNLGQGTGLTLGDTAGASDARLTYTGATASVARELTLNGNGGEIQVATADTTLTITSAVSGTGLLTKSGPGALVLSRTGGAGFGGGVTLTGGSLSMAQLGASTGTITISNNSTFIYAGSDSASARGVTLGTGGGTITVANAGSRLKLDGPVSVGSNLTIRGPGRLAFGGVATLSALPTIAPGGTLALLNDAGTNVLPTAGLTVPTGATLMVAPGAIGAGGTRNASALGNNTAPITLSGGTLRLGHEGLLISVYEGAPATANFTGTAGNVADFFQNLGPAGATGRSTAGGRTTVDFSNTATPTAAPFTGIDDVGTADDAVDNIRAFFSGKILITNPGVTTFFTTSDDGSGIYIDGQRVVDNNFFQGATERSGSINLTAGLHDFQMYFYEGAVDAGISARYTPAGGTKQLIPNSILLAGDVFEETTARGVNVTASSTLQTGLLARLGELIQNAATKLTTEGSFTFTGTTLAAGTGSYAFETNIGDLNLGTIATSGKTIDKSGVGSLVFSNPAPAGTTINVNGGLVVSQGSSIGGTTTDPLAGVTINYASGGGLGFSSTAGDPTYTRNMTAAGSYAIEAGRFGSTLAASTITWAPANNTVSVASNATATFNVRNSGYTLVVAAPISGAGAVVVNEGKVNFTGATFRPGDVRVNLAEVVVSGAVTTGAITVSGALPQTNVTGTPSVTGTSDLAVSGLRTASTVEATSVNVSGGAFTADGVLTNTGALTMSGGTATLSALATNASIALTGGTLTASGELRSTGAFTVRGGVAQLNGATTAGSLDVSAGGTVNLVGNLTATGGVTLGTGGTLNLNPGPGVTNTYTGGTFTINGGTLRAQSGTTDFGGAAVTVTPQTFAPGLLEGLILNTTDINTTTPNPGTGRPGFTTTGGIRLFPRMGETATKDNDHWGDNETWVYTGQFFDADGAFTFAENIDDRVRLKIDNVEVLSDNGWNVVTSSGNNNYGMGPTGTGWHDFEVRFQNGGGGAGTVAGNGWGGGDNLTFQNKGFGLNATGTDSVDGNDYVIPIDPGNATVFRVAQSGGGSLVADAGGVLAVGSVTGAESVAVGEGARFRLNDRTGPVVASTAQSLQLSPGATAGAVTVGTNNSLTVGRVSMGEGSTFTKDGAGTLIVSGMVAGTADLVASQIGTGTLEATAGTLLVNSTLIGTDGKLQASGTGIVGGTGTIEGALAAANGGTIAPGANGIGRMTAGTLAMQAGSKLTLELTSPTSHDSLSIAGAAALGNATLQLQLVNFTGAFGDLFFVLSHGGTSAVTGTFAGLADQALFTVGDRQFQISYDANDQTRSFDTGGNDVALRLIPEPTTAATLLTGLGMLLSLRRPRRRTA